MTSRRHEGTPTLLRRVFEYVLIALALALIAAGHWLYVYRARAAAGFAATALGTGLFLAAGYTLVKSKAPTDASKPGTEPYTWCEAPARRIKILLQMLIGAGFVAQIGWEWFFRAPDLKPLELAGRALEYATAVQLLYSLFTPGLDEAVEPAIMAVGATILLGLPTSGSLSIQNAGAIIGYGLVLAVLFWIKDRFSP